MNMSSTCTAVKKQKQIKYPACAKNYWKKNLTS